MAVGAARGAQSHERADEGASLLGHGPEHALVLAPVRRDHDVGHAPPQVLPHGESVHVGQHLVEVDVAQVLVEHDEADRTGLEERVEEDEVRLDPVELVAPAGQPHDDGVACRPGHGEHPEPAVEDPGRAVPGGHPHPPVAQAQSAFHQLGGPAGGSRGGFGEEGRSRPGQDLLGRVAEQMACARAPVADPSPAVQAEHGHGDVFQQGARLGPDGTGGVGVRTPGPVRWHQRSPFVEVFPHCARHPGGGPHGDPVPGRWRTPGAHGVPTGNSSQLLPCT